MRGKSKSKRGIFAPGDGRPRGWLKMQKKSKYIRGEAVKKVSKMGTSILRDHARSEGTTVQLRSRGISTQPKLTHNTENESNSYRIFLAGKYASCST